MLCIEDLLYSKKKSCKMMFTENLTKVDDNGDSSPYSDDASRESSVVSERIPEWLDSQRTVKKTIITTGHNLKCPRANSNCQVLAEQLEGPTLSEYPLEFKLNETCNILMGECDSAIGKNIEKVLLTMKEKEVCEALCIIKKQEFLEVENVVKMEETSFPDCIEFRFKIELLLFQEQPDIHQLDDSVKLESAIHHKAVGVQLFQKGRPRAAFCRFSKAAKLLIYLGSDESDEKSSLQVACYLNMAACQLQTSMYEHAVQNCTKALGKDDNNVKAYYRRGVAYLNLKDYEKSLEDLNKVIVLDPKSEVAKQKIRIVTNEKKKLDRYYSKQLSKLFA